MLYGQYLLGIAARLDTYIYAEATHVEVTFVNIFPKKMNFINTVLKGTIWSNMICLFNAIAGIKKKVGRENKIYLLQ